MTNGSHPPGEYGHDGEASTRATSTMERPGASNEKTEPKPGASATSANGSQKSDKARS